MEYGLLYHTQNVKLASPRRQPNKKGIVPGQRGIIFNVSPIRKMLFMKNGDFDV